MEIFSSSFLVKIVFFFLLWKLTRRFLKDPRNLLIPNILQGEVASDWKYAPSICSLPHHALRDLAKKCGPIMHLQLGEISTIIISVVQEVKEVLKVHDVCIPSRTLASKILGFDYLDILFSPYGDYWKQMQKFCLVEILNPKNVRSFATIREDEAWKFIRCIKSSSNLPLNVVEKIFLFTNSIVCRTALGKRFTNQDLLISLINEAILLGEGFDIADLFPSLKFLHWMSGLKKLHHKIDNVLDNIINKHKEKLTSGSMPTDAKSMERDLVDVLLRLKEIGGFEIRISENSIKAIIWDLFATRTETSAATIDWAMSEHGL